MNSFSTYFTRYRVGLLSPRKAFITLLLFVVLAVLSWAITNVAEAKASNGRTSHTTKARDAYRTNLQTSHADNQKLREGLWKDVTESQLPGGAIAENRPKSYRLLELDPTSLMSILEQAPIESAERATQPGVVLPLPQPDGHFENFRIEESPILSPELAAKFPEIRTYQGQSVDNPTASMRLTWSPRGLNAYILSDQGSFMISRDETDSRFYLSYFTRDVKNAQFECVAPSFEKASDISELLTSQFFAANSLILSNGTRRLYRLSFTVSQQFYQHFGGPVISPPADAAVTSAIAAYVSNFTLIYEREMSVRFMFNSWFADRPGVCGNPGFNCFPPTQEPTQMMQPNQFVLDNVYPGANNYDLGAALGYSFDPLPSGYSSFGSGSVGGACEGFYKGQSATRLVGAAGDYLGTTILAHELGHMFGARHTFSSSIGVCGGALDPEGRVEPGSGSTIMSYTPVCGADNLFTGGPSGAANDYFHVHSLLRIANHKSVYSSCGQSTSTGNLAPIITDAGSTANIPAFTPFMLNAVATDPDGDALTYDWEEFDPGTTLFRSYSPTENSSRTFPSLTYVLNNANVPPTFVNGFLSGEVLPSFSRVLNFTVTVRDNRSGSGGTVARDQLLQVNVIGGTGPFKVTQPNASGTFAGGQPLTIAWNVAGTNLAPISTANVRISLSTDGGSSFPIVLTGNTANDGSEVVTLPNLQTVAARIRIDAVNNIYFDVSDTNFSVSATVTPTVTAGLYNPAGGGFFLRNSNSSGVADISFAYGPAGAGWLSLVGDWNGDGVDSIGLYNPAAGTFFLRNNNSTGIADISFAFGPGGAGWLPLVGDWNGDGVDTVGLYNPAAGTFFLRNSNSTGVADISFAYGPAGAGWLPLVGDWNGDSTTTVGLYNPTAGGFFLRNSNSTGVADISFAYGPAGAGWLPLVGDWNGDGTTTVGLYNPAAGGFFLRNSNSTGVADIAFSYGPVGAGWKPLMGDWNGQ